MAGENNKTKTKRIQLENKTTTRKKQPEKKQPEKKTTRKKNNTNKNKNKIPVMNWFLTDNNTHDQSTQNHYKNVHEPRPPQTVSFLNIPRGENQPLKK